MTKRIFYKLTFMLFTLIFNFTLYAQSTAPKGKPGKPTVYDFSEVDILGNVKKPEGSSIKERPETYFKRLFDLDESFIPNIVRSVEDF